MGRNTREKLGQGPGCQPPLGDVVVEVANELLASGIDLDRAEHGEHLGFQVVETGTAGRLGKQPIPTEQRAERP